MSPPHSELHYSPSHVAQPHCEKCGPATFNRSFLFSGGSATFLFSFCKCGSTTHCVKSVRIRSYSGPHFPAFGLNMERYSISLRVQSECGKMRTKIIPNTDTFCAVTLSNCTSMWVLQRLNNLHIKTLFTDSFYSCESVTFIKNYFSEHCPFVGSAL